jgi:hypothetical protein
MKSEKGYWWASDYWSTIVYREVVNELFDGNPYAGKGDDNWQVIALAEGWAYYREEYLRRVYLEPNYAMVTTSFPRTYVQMFRELRNLGCSFANMERSLCTYSIAGFRDNLTSKYPGLSNQITNVVQPYL